MFREYPLYDFKFLKVIMTFILRANTWPFLMENLCALGQNVDSVVGAIAFSKCHSDGTYPTDFFCTCSISD